MILFLISLLSFACEDALDLNEDFTECDSSGTHFFEPTNKTFIPPAKSSFIEILCTPLELQEDISYFDLSASKICLMEQQLGLMSESLSSELCDSIVKIQDLDAYYYQYVGLRMGGQDYIFVNAFQPELLDSLDWKSEPFVGFCKNGNSQWSVLFNLDDLNFEQYQSQLIRELIYLPEFPYFCTRCISISDLETFPLDMQDICILNTHINKLQEPVSTGCYNSGYMVDLSEGWLLQYLGVHKNGSRWIYINAATKSILPEDHTNEYLELLYSHFIDGCDGGRAFWGILFDLDTYEFTDLQFNDCK